MAERERILLLTGHLACHRLEKLLTGLGDTSFEWSIFDVGVKVEWTRDAYDCSSVQQRLVALVSLQRTASTC